MVSRIGPGQYLAETGRKGTWVARRMGISQGYLSNLLRGKRRWSLPLRERFAAAVGKAEAEFDFAKSYAKTPSKPGRFGREGMQDGRTSAGVGRSDRRGVGSDPDAARVAEEG